MFVEEIITASGCECSCPQHLPVTEETAVQRLIKNENMMLVSTKLKLLKLAYVNKYFTWQFTSSQQCLGFGQGLL